MVIFADNNHRTVVESLAKENWGSIKAVISWDFL